MTTVARLGRQYGVWSRVVATVLFVLQALLLVALPLGDARAEARSATASAHVEAGTSDGCVPGHEHEACAVCRTLRTLGVTTSSSALVPSSAQHDSGASQPRTDGFDSSVAQPLHSRAPPAG